MMFGQMIISFDGENGSEGWNASMTVGFRKEAKMFNIEELERQLERLVDGELPEEERTQLLWMLDEIPDGWKRCACAFLRSQCYQEVLDSIGFGDASTLTAMADEDSLEEAADIAAFTHAAGDLSDDETFREWVRKQCEAVTSESVTEREFVTQCLHVSDEANEVENEGMGPVVTMVLREGGTVVAREPASPAVEFASSLGSDVLAKDFDSDAVTPRGAGLRAFRRVQRYAMRNWAAWSGTITAIAISFMLGSWYMNPRTLLPLSPEEVSQLAANLPANQEPGPPLAMRYGQSEAVDTASQEAERRGVSSRVLNGDAAAMMQAVMQSRSVDSSNKPNSGRATPATDSAAELAITTSTDPQTGTVYYHNATDTTGATGQSSSSHWTNSDQTNSGYLTLESELEFEKYYDYDRGTWNLVAVFDGEQNPERSQNDYILSDASVAMLRAAGYEVVQQREMMIQNDSSNRQDGAFTMSEIPVSRTQIRYVGP